MAFYLLVLGYFTIHKDRWKSVVPLRKAWFRFGLIPVTMAVFALVRAGNYDAPRDLLLTEIWQNGFVWMFLGLSIFSLSGLLGDES